MGQNISNLVHIPKYGHMVFCPDSSLDENSNTSSGDH